MKKTNVYSFRNENGAIEATVHADTKKQAAILLRCSPDHVEFREQVRRTDLQRRGDRATKMPVHMWRSRMWAKLTGALVLALLASCSVMREADIHGVRFSAGAFQTKTTDLESTVKSRGQTARIELTNKKVTKGEDIEVGIELTGRQSDLVEGVSLDVAGIGMVARNYFLGSHDGDLRGYFGARLGYQAGWMDVPEYGQSEQINMLYAGAFLGVEARLGRSVSLFAEGGYEGAMSIDQAFAEHGPVGTVGISISF